MSYESKQSEQSVCNDKDTGKETTKILTSEEIAYFSEGSKNGYNKSAY